MSDDLIEAAKAAHERSLAANGLVVVDDAGDNEQPWLERRLRRLLPPEVFALKKRPVGPLDDLNEVYSLTFERRGRLGPDGQYAGFTIRLVDRHFTWVVGGEPNEDYFEIASWSGELRRCSSNNVGETLLAAIGQTVVVMG